MLYLSAKSGSEFFKILDRLNDDGSSSYTSPEFILEKRPLSSSSATTSLSAEKSVILYNKTPRNTTMIPETLMTLSSSPNIVTPTRMVIISFKTPPIIRTIAFDLSINQNSQSTIAIAMNAPVNPSDIVLKPFSKFVK